jgi:anti-sigma regulatory factor (Ser/Thr protein kinase)
LKEAEVTSRELFEIQLAIAEAVANAVEHPEAPTSHLVEIEGLISNRTVTLSVRDYGRWQDERSHKEEGGLGLEIIQELMDNVEFNCIAEGTTVTMRRRLGMH